MLLLAKSFYGLLQVDLHCSFLLNLLLHDLSSLHDCPSSGHVLLYQVKTFIFLVKACQLVFDDSFDFFHGILLHISLGLGLLV
jgi:hypothetical protein